MTIRNLDKMFAPRSVALIGASARPGSVGLVVLRNLSSAGFAGRIMAVNPKAGKMNGSLGGIEVTPDIASLPETPDLAVIATPPDTVPQLVEKLGRLGTRSAVVITAGFGEGGCETGHRLRQQMLESARPHLLRIVGPNVGHPNFVHWDQDSSSFPS